MADASRFSTSANTLLDQDGNGVITLAPRGEKWQIDLSNVVCSTHILEAEVRVYIGQIADMNQIDGTYSGSSGDRSDTVIYLHDGEQVIFVWQGGDPGAQATVKITGWTTTPVGGFRAVL